MSNPVVGSGNLARLLSEKVHQYELAERHGVREVSFAAAYLGHLLHELDERPVAGQHEGIDHDAGPPAVRDLLERFAHDGEVEAHRVLVDQPIRHRQRARLASVIITIWRMSFFCAMRILRESLSPSAVFVRYGPTCAWGSIARGISSAES